MLKGFEIFFWFNLNIKTFEKFKIFKKMHSKLNRNLASLFLALNLTAILKVTISIEIKPDFTLANGTLETNTLNNNRSTIKKEKEKIVKS